MNKIKKHLARSGDWLYSLGGSWLIISMMGPNIGREVVLSYKWIVSSTAEAGRVVFMLSLFDWL